MFRIAVSTVNFTEKLKRYQELTGKALGEVVKEQARLLAERLTRLTFPTSQSQGKKRVAIDLGRVYLSDKWFTDVFQFRSQSLEQAVKNAVQVGDTDTLLSIFQRSDKLNQIRIEGFDASQHSQLRRDGRVLVPNPRSFPVGQQGSVERYIQQKQANVGLAKGGWAVCGALLGKSVPKWMQKNNAGRVEDNSEAAENPHIILTNKVSFFSAMDSKANIVSRALEGRARDMIRSAQKQLERAAEQAGLS